MLKKITSLCMVLMCVSCTSESTMPTETPVAAKPIMFEAPNEFPSFYASESGEFSLYFASAHSGIYTNNNSRTRDRRMPETFDWNGKSEGNILELTRENTDSTLIVEIKSETSLELKDIAGFGEVLLSKKSMENMNAELVTTYWRLVSLKGKDVQVFDNQPEPHLFINEGQAAGSDGCNNFFMPIIKPKNPLYALLDPQKDGTLAFGHGGSTMKLCHEGEEQARNYLMTLQGIDSFEITGTVLELKSKGQTQLIFEATAL